jgi:hypothetical protein
VLCSHKDSLVPEMATKRGQLSDEERDAALVEIRALMDKHHKQGVVGDLLGFSQQAVGLALRRGQVGPTMGRAIAAHLGLDDIGQLVRRRRGRAELQAIDPNDYPPERAEAAAMLRRMGVDEQDVAVLYAAGEFRPMPGQVLPPLKYWVRLGLNAESARLAALAAGLTPAQATAQRQRRNGAPIAERDEELPDAHRKPFERKGPKK